MSGRATSPALALRDLRGTRNQRHREEIEWVDALYRAYVSVLAAAAAVWVAAAKVGDGPVSAGAATDIAGHGAAGLGLLAAVVVGIGLRSGGRGGPLTLEAADVRIILLAPISRRLALRGPAVRQFRSTIFAGFCVGTVGGNLAGHRLPGRFALWVVGGAVFGTLVAALALGGGFLACGLRLGRRVSSGLAVGLIGWSALDLFLDGATSPLTFLGRVGLAGMVDTAHRGTVPKVAGGPSAVAAVVAVALTGAVVVAAVARLGSISLEAAEHRGRLASQLRFALTLQDLRTIVLLRRRLSAEEPRARPWVRLPATSPFRFLGSLGSLSGGPVAAAVRRRGWQSILRWPVTRLLRVAGLGVIAGLAAGGMWGGTTPLLLVSGLALFVAALDALEPLAQEMDHPTRRDSYPVAAGSVVSAAVVAPAVVLAVAVALSAVTGGLVAQAPLTPFLLTILPATAGAVAGGVASLVLEPVSAAEIMSKYLLPETAGPMIIARLGFAPSLAIAGWLPLLAGRAAAGDQMDPEPAVVQAGILLIGIVIGIVVLLVRYFDRKLEVPPT